MNDSNYNGEDNNQEHLLIPEVNLKKSGSKSANDITHDNEQSSES